MDVNTVLLNLKPNSVSGTQNRLMGVADEEAVDSTCEEDFEDVLIGLVVVGPQIEETRESDALAVTSGVSETVEIPVGAEASGTHEDFVAEIGSLEERYLQEQEGLTNPSDDVLQSAQLLIKPSAVSPMPVSQNAVHGPALQGTEEAFSSHSVDSELFMEGNDLLSSETEEMLTLSSRDDSPHLLKLNTGSQTRHPVHNNVDGSDLKLQVSEESLSVEEVFSEKVVRYESIEQEASSEILDEVSPRQVMDSSKFASRLIGEASVRWESLPLNSGTQFTMRLDPPELGEVIVRMQKNENQISMSVQALDPKTQSLIEENFGELRNLLTEHDASIDLQQHSHDRAENFESRSESDRQSHPVRRTTREGREVSVTTSLGESQAFDFRA